MSTPTGGKSLERHVEALQMSLILLRAFSFTTLFGYVKGLVSYTVIPRTTFMDETCSLLTRVLYIEPENYCTL